MERPPVKRPTGAGGRELSDSIYLRARHENHNGLAAISLPFQYVRLPPKGFSVSSARLAPGGTRYLPLRGWDVIWSHSRP